MKLETFFEHFDLLTDAPNAAAKLREIVLQLAVRGKLIAQHPDDEYANLLIKRIRKKRDLLINEKKISKSRYNNCRVFHEKVPYLLPNSWEWISLAEVGHDWGQKKPDAEFTYIDVSAIDKEQGLISEECDVLQPNEAPSRARKIVKKDTIIYSTIRPYLLNIAIVDGEFSPEPIVSTAFAVIHPFEGILNKFIYYYLRSKPFIEYVESQMLGMAYPAVNDSNLFKGLVPLPPLAEQKRIVEKVDRLLILCDAIDKHQQQRQQNLLTINDTALAQLLAAPTPDDFQHHWQGICNNFDLLYSTPETIPKLRQAILQLAVQGKLVPQDPNDEPASVLLERIRIEKGQLDPNKAEKNEFLLPIFAINTPFNLPKGWAWSRFPELGEFGRGKSKHRPRNDPKLYKDGKYPLVQTGDIARSKGTIKTYTGCYNDLGLNQSRMWSKGTLCITIAANIADSGLLDFDACIPDSVVGFVPLNEINNARYFEYFMRTAKEHLQDYAPSTAQKNINLGILEKVLIPLPPLAEQKRIVAKVDSLLALCDTLETKLKAVRDSSATLMDIAARQIVMTEGS